MKKAARLRCPLFPVVMLNPHGQLSSDSLRKASCLEEKCILPQQKSETVHFTLYSTQLQDWILLLCIFFWGVAIHARHGCTFPTRPPLKGQGLTPVG